MPFCHLLDTFSISFEKIAKGMIFDELMDLVSLEEVSPIKAFCYNQ